jgi:hypothetical protein
MIAASVSGNPKPKRKQKIIKREMNEQQLVFRLQ